MPEQQPSSCAQLEPTLTTTNSNLTRVHIAQQRRKSMLKGRVAALDPSIGLHLLGQEGRTLLAQYIGVKSQQRARRNVAYDCSKKGNVSMAIKIITAQTLMLKQQIKKAQDQIAHLDKLLTNPARPLSKTTEERYLTMLDEAEADLARLQRKQAEWQEVEEPQSITYGRRRDCSHRRQSRTVRESFPSYGSSVYGHCD